MSQKRRNQTKRPNVKVSQNYLTGSETIKRIIQKTTITKQDSVIEIGPGKGHITGQLLKTCSRLTAVEIDDMLFDRLRAKYSGVNNLTLCHADFLEWPLPATGDYKLFSNTPFCFSTAIIRRLTECINPPAEAWLALQADAAKRYMGKPRETLRSLMIKTVYDMRIVYRFCREDFHPKPGVDVVLVYLKKKRKPDILACQRWAYERFIRRGLRGHAGLLAFFTPGQLRKALRESGARPDMTTGELLYVQWLCLFRCWRKQAAGKRP